MFFASLKIFITFAVTSWSDKDKLAKDIDGTYFYTTMV